MGDSRNIILGNIQVAANGDISGIIKEAKGLSEKYEFEQMFEQMNDHFNNEQMVSIINYSPRQNEICACKFASQWHRVKVEYVLSRKNGHCASCVFVDDGNDELVPVHWLRQLPSKFKHVPFQLKKVYLHGIQPVSMVISEEVMAVHMPVKVWDEAAVKFISDSIKAALRVMCVLMDKLSENALSVRLYMENRNGGIVCLNEVLVNQKYAINIADIEDASILKPKPKKTLEDVIRARQKKDMMSMVMSDSEISMKSDPELTMAAKSYGGTGTGVDKGYETDNLGVTVMSHRSIHRSPGQVNRLSLSPSAQGSNKMFDPWAEGDSDPAPRGRGRGDILSISSDNSKKSLNSSIESKLSAISCDEIPVIKKAPMKDLTSSDDDRITPRMMSSPLQKFEKSPSLSAVHKEIASSNALKPQVPKLLPPSSSSSPSPSHTDVSMSLHQERHKSPHTSGNTTPKASMSLSMQAVKSPHVSAITSPQMSMSPSMQSPKSPHMSANSTSHASMSLSMQSTNSTQISANTTPQASMLQSPQLSVLSSQCDKFSPNKPLAYGRGAFKHQLPKSPVSPKALCNDKLLVEIKKDLPLCGRGALKALLSNTGSLKPSQINKTQGNSDSEMLQGPGRTLSDARQRLSPGGACSESDSITLRTSTSKRLVNYTGGASSESELLCVSYTTEGGKLDETKREVLHRLGAFDDATTQNDKTQAINDNHTILNSDNLNHITHKLNKISMLNSHKDGSISDSKAQCVSSDIRATSTHQYAAKSASAYEYSSGSESSASTMSAVAASVLGQGGFKKSRLPKSALGGHREAEIVESRIPEKVSSPSKNSEKVDMLQKALKQIPEKPVSERLLERLGLSSRSQNSAAKGKLAVAKGMFGSADGVLVHGPRPPKPLYDFEEAHFSEHVRQAWQNFDFPAPTLVQAYTWPAITRGRHVVTISPTETGKTLAYMCPILSGMSDPRIYKELPTGNGPLTIIITQSWKSAERVYDMACKMLAGHKGIRPILIHGGGEEEQKACTLINGCELLVVTAPSLKRLLEAKYTEVRRLCHLIIDDADQVLETFGLELGFVVTEYTKIISSEMKRLECPRQILLLGSQWNKATEIFLNKVLVEPVLILTSSFEASIYGRVKQIVHMSRPDDRMKEVLGILSNLTDNTNKTIIFASTKEHIIKLFQVVRSCAHYCLMIHQDMELYQVEHVAEEWSHDLTLLITCDEYVSDLGITDATTIIHYDMPNSKTKFSNRLRCMRKTFYDFSNPDQKEGHEATSHLIITDRCRHDKLWHIYEMLQRTNSAIPLKLHDILAAWKEERDNDGERPLCDQLLAFGYCRDKWRCYCRHTIMPDIDVSTYSNWIPDEGEVKLVLSHAVDASHYFVRLLTVRHDNQEHDLSASYTRIQMDVSMWYSNLANKKRESAPYVGEICGYQESEVFHRVQILEFLDMNSKQEKKPIEAFVKFVDSGRLEEVPAFKLYELPEHLRKYPFQAVEVYMCRVRPMDKDTEWTHKACRHIHETVHGKTLEGKIVLRVGYTLWLDPIVMRVQLGEARTIINKFYVHTELIRHGLAIENENHLKRLHKLCDGKVNIPRALLIKTKMSQILQTDVLPACRQHHNVQLSSVRGPEFFYVQRKDKAEQLEELMDEIKDYVEKMDDGVEPPDIDVGAYCLAQYTSYDQGWYRGQVITVEEDSYEIIFADFGDKDFVPKDKVRVFPHDKFFELPLQAIECQLAHIKPQGKMFEQKAGDLIWDFSHFINNDLKDLVATVTDKVTATCAGQHRFVVELRIDSEKDDFNMSSELVWRHLALPEQGAPIMELFPQPVLLRKRISSCVLIPDLCAAIFWEKDSCKAKELAEEILSIVQRSAQSLRTTQLKSAVAGLHALMKLIGRVGWANVHSTLLDCVLCIAGTAEQFVEEMISVNLDCSLVHCLEMNSDTLLQHQAADFISRMANTSAIFRSVFQRYGNLDVLYELLSNTENEQVQGSLCRAFTALCARSEIVFHYLMEKQICSTLVTCLTKSHDHQISEAVILLVSKLSEVDSGHADLKRESLIEALVKNLKQTECDKCIQHSILMCDNFAATRRKHKTFLLELEMVPVLTRLLKLELQSTTMQLCKDLMSSLIIKVPSEPLSGVSIRSNQRDMASTTNSGIPPEVHWSQNSFNIILSVKVGEVPNWDNVVSFGENVVKFNALVAGSKYSFTYKLYGNIMETHSKVAIRTQEVLISMKKETQGKWPRLLMEKQKPANLFVDYERFVDSSCDSEVNDDERPFVLKRKKKKAFPFKPPTRTKTGENKTPSDESTDTDDSLENLMDPDDPYSRHYQDL